MYRESGDLHSWGGASIMRMFIVSLRGDLAGTHALGQEFARAGQMDWAVLCDYGSSTSLVLIWGGPQKCIGDLGKLDLKDSFSVNSDGATPAVFMRSIRIAGKRELKHGRPRINPIDHAGIFDETSEGTSQIHYCSHGKWKTSQAGD